jgi:hypothetical protein
VDDANGCERCKRGLLEMTEVLSFPHILPNSEFAATGSDKLHAGHANHEEPGNRPDPSGSSFGRSWRRIAASSGQARVKLSFPSAGWG